MRATRSAPFRQSRPGTKRRTNHLKCPVKIGNLERRTLVNVDFLPHYFCPKRPKFDPKTTRVLLKNGPFRTSFRTFFLQKTEMRRLQPLHLTYLNTFFFIFPATTAPPPPFFAPKRTPLWRTFACTPAMGPKTVDSTSSPSQLSAPHIGLLETSHGRCG